MMEREPSWKKKQFEILCKIDEICRLKDIDMCLCDSTALKAYCEGKLSDSVFIAIEPKDACRFIDAIVENSDYGIRGIYNYYHYPEFDLKVYDENTIDFNLITYRDFDFCGLYVTVKFIMHLPDSKRKRYSYLRDLSTYKEYISWRYDSIKFDMNNRLRLQLFIGRFMSRGKFCKTFFKMNTKRFAGKSTQVKIGEAICDADFFSSRSVASINGRDFFIAGSPEKYFQCRYGNGWETRGVGPYEEHNYRFRDGDHSWKEFNEYIKYLDLDTYYVNRNISHANVIKNRPLEKCWQRDKYIVERSHLRFVFWQKYIPIKNNILELHNSKQNEQLREVLSPYLDQLERFGNSKLSIFFDEDIYNIALELLAADGKDKLVNTLRTTIPPQHKDGVIIKNSRGERV